MLNRKIYESKAGPYTFQSMCGKMETLQNSNRIGTQFCEVYISSKHAAYVTNVDEILKIVSNSAETTADAQRNE